MRNPDDGTAGGPTETLQAGPSRPPLFQSIPARWRQHATAPVAFVLGIAAGAGTVLWWQAQPTPPPFRADEHAVELVLTDVVAPRTIPGGQSETTPLHVEAALLLSGAVTSTVSGIEASDEGLDVRAPDLPVTVSPTDRFKSVRLRISVRDCETATHWEPAERPFAITWRDEFDREHVDRAGDFDRSTSNALSSYVDAVCAG